EPFIWQRAYSPLTGNDDWSLSSMWVRNRLHTIHKILAPSQEWDPNAETMSYPFAIKPEKKISVADVMEMLRSHMEGTPFDMYESAAWFVSDGEKVVKSPIATPFPTRAVRKVLDIPYNRPVSKWDCAYSFVSQARAGVPDVMKTVLWFGYDNPHTTCYVPIYNGVTDTKESWRTFDRNQFSLGSAQWSFILADDLVNHRYGDAMADMRSVREPLENGFFARIPEIDAKAAELYKKDPAAAKKFLTEFTLGCMDETEKAWWNLNWTLITKYNNNKFN
ncbi:MAG: peptidase, partial [Synergistales bacterium]|nr:peptidase [Synergistales bacterium]